MDLQNGTNTVTTLAVGFVEPLLKTVEPCLTVSGQPLSFIYVCFVDHLFAIGTNWFETARHLV